MYKFVNLNGYLGLEKNGITVYVYRCLLHANDRLGRKLIPSYIHLPGDKSIQKVLLPFHPVFVRGNEDFSQVGKTRFDVADRDDINPPRQLGIQQWRYYKWQIYEFLGELTDKDCSLPGIWSRIPIGETSSPEEMIASGQNTSVIQELILPNPDTLEEPESWDASDSPLGKLSRPPGFGP